MRIGWIKNNFRIINVGNSPNKPRTKIKTQIPKIIDVNLILSIALCM